MGGPFELRHFVKKRLAGMSCGMLGECGQTSA